MALRCNGYRLGDSVFRHVGGALVSIYGASRAPRNMGQLPGRMRGLAWLTANVSGLPMGALPPHGWMLPQKPGVIASRGALTGFGGVASAAQSGYNIAATLTGEGSITASAGLIVTLAASIAGSGGVSSATTQALATMVATLTGAGSVTAAAAGLAAMTANLTGAGSVTANNTALADIAATIRGYGEASAEGIRDALWNAQASSYNTAGTMGQKLNLAGSGGVDNDALAAAVWAHVTRTLTGVTAANITQVRGQNLDGSGTEVDPWGPA